MATNAVYKRWNGTGWEEFHFRTSASQVGVTSNRKFITASTLVNGQAFTLGANDSNVATVNITGAHTANGVTGSHNYINAGENISVSLVALDAAAKAAYDNIPSGILTESNYTTTLDARYLKLVDSLDATKLNGKVPESCLPDYILGQLMYGGTFDAYLTVSLTTNAKSKLGVSNNGLTLTNDTGPITGYTAHEGIYYIVTVAQTFANLDLNVGDWLVATSSGWKKVDNTDAIASWCGLTGNITLAQAQNSLGGEISANSTGFVTGSAVHTALGYKLDHASGIRIYQDENSPLNGNYAWDVDWDEIGGIWFHDYHEDDADGMVGYDNHTLYGTGGALFLYSKNGVVVTSEWNNRTTKSVKLKTTNVTGLRTLQMPDHDGTIATTYDIASSIAIFASTDVATGLAGKVDKVTGSQLIETTKITSYDNHLANTSNPHSVTKAQVGLGNVDNTSDATKKSNFTGSVADGNTGFATGGAVYTALAGKLDSVSDFRKWGSTQYAWYVGYDTFRGVNYYFTGDDADNPDFCGFIGMNTNDWGNEIIIQATEGLVITTTNDIQDRTGAVLQTTNLTDTRTVQFPDKDGTLAMTSDVPTFTISTSQPSNPKAGDVWIDTDA